MDKSQILKDVSNYYTDKVTRFGNTPQGVDWNGVESQYVRFEELSKVIQADKNFSLLDYGCGYGGYLTYLMNNYEKFSYNGFDISTEMINSAVQTHGKTGINWYSELPSGEMYDYTIASGIFNVMLQSAKEDWEKYILDTLNNINTISRKGFSFNLLTKYSDIEFMKDYLYYADPLYVFDYCKRNFSKYVALLHDYPLYEFTVIVRK